MGYLLWIVLISAFKSTSSFISPRYGDKSSRLGYSRTTGANLSLQRHHFSRSLLRLSSDDEQPMPLVSDSKEKDSSDPEGADFKWNVLGITGVAIAIPLLAYIGMAHGEALTTTVIPLAASAASKNIFDPSQFQPVCPASDGVYQVLKLTANSLVGQDNVVEYGPLIASVLLRIRLELCVLESFLYEAVLPFIQKKGLTWVLPLHETVETFLAGTIFAIASNFILLGSTKILSILFIYADALTGMPTRFIGGALKKLPAKSTGERIGSVIKFYGDVLGGARGLLETGDTFVGRYLVVATTIYIAFKFAHFKLFNDLIPF